VPISLNAPIPGRVKRLASELEPDLYGFDRVRERHTLLVKRFGERDPSEYARLETRLRRVLRGTPAFEARVGGIDAFERPAFGPGPVVYLAVESPGLIALHERLCEAFEPVEGLEGEAYVPHVTLARGGDLEAAHRLCDRSVDPVTWTVSELTLRDATYGEVASRFSLPA
jgi:2'-5' RNA ligase